MILSQLLAQSPAIAFLFGYSAPVAFGFFSAYWAQQTHRNPWAWFAFGSLLTPIAGVALLMLNRDRAPEPAIKNLSPLVVTRKDLP